MHANHSIIKKCPVNAKMEITYMSIFEIQKYFLDL